MNEEGLEAVHAAFESAESYDRRDDRFVVTTTAFEGAVTVAESEDGAVVFSVRLSVPTLDEASSDAVSKVVVQDWFETLERRLAEAGKATRLQVDFVDIDVEKTDGTVRIGYDFETETPENGPAIAKTLVEYVEGTYVEGIVPGYEYVSQVADLLASASHSGDGGTPL